MHVIQRDKSNVKYFIRIAAPIINQEICIGVSLIELADQG